MECVLKDLYFVYILKYIETRERKNHNNVLKSLTLDFYKKLQTTMERRQSE